MGLGEIIGKKVKTYEEILCSIFNAKRRIKSNKHSRIKTEVFMKSLMHIREANTYIRLGIY